MKKFSPLLILIIFFTDNMLNLWSSKGIVKLSLNEHLSHLSSYEEEFIKNNNDRDFRLINRVAINKRVKPGDICTSFYNKVSYLPHEITDIAMEKFFKESYYNKVFNMELYSIRPDILESMSKSRESSKNHLHIKSQFKDLAKKISFKKVKIKLVNKDRFQSLLGYLPSSGITVFKSSNIHIFGGKIDGSMNQVDGNQSYFDVKKNLPLSLTPLADVICNTFIHKYRTFSGYLPLYNLFIKGCSAGVIGYDGYFDIIYDYNGLKSSILKNDYIISKAFLSNDPGMFHFLLNSMFNLTVKENYNIPSEDLTDFGSFYICGEFLEYSLLMNVVGVDGSLSIKALERIISSTYSKILNLLFKRKSIIITSNIGAFMLSIDEIEEPSEEDIDMLIYANLINDASLYLTSKIGETSIIYNGFKATSFEEVMNNNFGCDTMTTLKNDETVEIIDFSKKYVILIRPSVGRKKFSKAKDHSYALIQAVEGGFEFK